MLWSSFFARMKGKGQSFMMQVSLGDDENSHGKAGINVFL